MKNLDLILRTQGVLEVDQNLPELAHLLKQYNFHVITQSQNLEEYDYRRNILTYSIFITNASEEYLQSWPELDCGFITVEKVMDLELYTLAEMVSKAIVDSKLWSKRRGYILILMQNGIHEFKTLATG